LKLFKGKLETLPTIFTTQGRRGGRGKVLNNVERKILEGTQLVEMTRV
jgi:hypothetical protein